MKTQNTARTLFKGGAVITMDAAVPNLATGDVLVERNRIAAVGANLQADAAEVIDASESIVMPGFIDAHHHMWLGVVRRMMPNVDDLAAYFELIGRKMGLKYRPLDMHLSTRLTARFARRRHHDHHRRLPPFAQPGAYRCGARRTR